MTVLRTTVTAVKISVFADIGEVSLPRREDRREVLPADEIDLV